MHGPKSTICVLQLRFELGILFYSTRQGSITPRDSHRRRLQCPLDPIGLVDRETLNTLPETLTDNSKSQKVLIVSRHLSQCSYSNDHIPSQFNYDIALTIHYSQDIRVGDTLKFNRYRSGKEVARDRFA